MLCEAQNSNLTRNRKQTGVTSFASPLVLATPQTGSALTVCDEMLQFMINATIYRGDLYLLVYELNQIQNATFRNSCLFSLSLNDHLRSCTRTTSLDLFYVLSNRWRPSKSSLTLCFDLIAIGFMFWLEIKVLVGRTKEHLAAEMLANHTLARPVRAPYLILIQSL